MSAQVEVLAADRWATTVADRLLEHVRDQPSIRLCLPTGDTPSPLYAELVRQAADRRISLGDATVVLLDEYVGLPPDDPARCDARLERELFAHLDSRPTVHRIEVDSLPPDAAADRHDAIAADGLDLALLGLGANGHVGLNEPGSTADSPTRVVELAPASLSAATDRYGAGRLPRAGVTLGMARLLEARELWLLVTGAGKADVLSRALRGPETPACPASLLRRHPRLRVVADESAAANLER